MYINHEIYVFHPVTGSLLMFVRPLLLSNWVMRLQLKSGVSKIGSAWKVRWDVSSFVNFRGRAVGFRKSCSCLPGKSRFHSFSHTPLSRWWLKAFAKGSPKTHGFPNWWHQAPFFSLQGLQKRLYFCSDPPAKRKRIAFQPSMFSAFTVSLREGIKPWPFFPQPHPQQRLGPS